MEFQRPVRPRFVERAVLALILFCWPGIQPASAGSLQFIQRELELGIVSKGKNAPLVFKIKNTSANSIKIVSAEGSCRCISLQNAPDEILPRTTGTFAWLFASARATGLVKHTVTVETADGQNIVGEFQAWVEPPGAIVVEPEEPALAMQPGHTVAAGEFIVSGRREVLATMKFEFPKSINAITVSKPSKIKSYPALREIACRISVRHGAAEPMQREIVRLRAGEHHLDIPIQIAAPSRKPEQPAAPSAIP